jgi:CRP-like cAMP-binding protein
MGEQEERRQFLGRTPFFGGLEGPTLDLLIGKLVERNYAGGAAIFHEGEQGRSMYIVRSGELMKTQRGESGFPVKLMRFRPGDFFGETTLIEMQPRQFSVVAEGPVSLYELTNMGLYQLYQKNVEAYVMVLQNINRELCRRLRKAEERITAYADERGEEGTQIHTGVGKIRRKTPPRDF